MSIKDFKDIYITDEDIDWIETILGKDIHFDHERRDVIKCLESIDIKACPGSGKTTTLVAKLAILAKKWPYDDFGICVLSHTNVAREEIQVRLGNYEIGRRLLSYPHFIGTVQSFFDTYLAIPWLKSNDYIVERIDTDYAISKRFNMLDYESQVSMKRNKIQKNKLCYVNNINELDDSVSSYLVGDVSTISLLYDVIHRSQKDGFFTYDEMYLFGKQLLVKYPMVSNIIAKKFPVLFIDEAQDTNELQWELIGRAFKNENCMIIQAFGDENQDIFSDSLTKKKLEFSVQEPFCISKSKRFNDSIAKLANTVAVDNENMIGDNSDFLGIDVHNTIFLYSREKIKEVLNAYGELITSTFTQEEIDKYKDLGCHAVGQVQRKKTVKEIEKLPQSVADYWDGYNDKKNNPNKQPENLVGFVRKGINSFNETGERGAFFREIFSGLKALNSLFVKNDRAVITGSNFTNSLFRLKEDNKKVVLQIITEMANVDNLTGENWSNICVQFFNLLQEYGLKASEEVLEESYEIKRFLEWEEDDEYCCDDPEMVNCFHYINPNNGVSVDIELGSVHSVKGKTHLATLVLETFFCKHNITSILQYLAGDRIVKEECDEWDIKRLKCQYVAMTRPKALLCLALPIDNVDDSYRQELENLGWYIKKVV